MDGQNKSLSINHISEEFRLSAFMSIIKYPTLYFSVCSIYVPHLCARNMYKPDDSLNDKMPRSKQDTHVIEIISIGENTPDIKSNRMTEVNDGANNKSINETTATGCTIHKWSRKIKPVEKKDFKRNKNGGGNLSPCCKMSLVTYFKIAFCCSFIPCEILDAVRLIYITTGTVSNDNHFVYSLANITFRLFLLFMTVTSSFANYNHFRPTCCAWLEYERKYGLKMDFKTYWKRARYWFAFSLLISIFIFSTVSIGILTSFEALRYQMWPFDMTTTLNKCAATILYALLSFLGSCTIFSVHIFRSTLVRVLVTEFQYLHDQMTEILSATSNHSKTEEEFDKLIAQLRLLIELTQASFQLIKHSIAAAYIFTPVMLCLVLYDVAGGNMLWNQNMLTMYTVVMVLLMISSITVLCARMRSEARSVWRAVYEVPWSHHSPAMLHKLSIFMSQLSVDDVSYSVYGMFTVDYSSLLMVGGTVLTYGIFVLQLKLDDKK